MDITKIVTLLVELIVVISTTFIIPWIKEKTDASKRAKILAYADIAVGAAEQLAKSKGWDGPEKKEYALEYLEKLGLSINYDEIDAIIENAVIKLHNELATV